MNQFGKKIRQLRKKNHLLQRDVAVQLHIDIPMLSKLEKGIRTAKKNQVECLADIFKVSKGELLSLWLADQVCKLVKHEENAFNALRLASEQLKISRIS